MTTTVTALLVSHDGDRWLPAVLDGLRDQTRRPDRVVAVDTGSTDDGPRMLRERLGAEAVHTLPAGTGYGTAVAAGLDRLPPTSDPTDPPTEWVWLLHDDSAPAPDALEQLLAFAGRDRGVALLGAKLREWPAGRRLLEVGVTIGGTGHRETGLERGEYDQGQHDDPRDVLAVNTAGLLVRRPVLDSLGLDPRLPVFGADLDLGWRAARRGHRVAVAPGAVVFHAEASHRGLRPSPGTGRGAERAANLYVLLANGSAAGLPFRLVRLLLGSLLRALGLLLVRAPGEALDELVAVATTYLRPQRLLAGRRERRRGATVPPRAVRALLAPAWLPYRHGLDTVADVASAVLRPSGEHTAGRGARTREPPALRVLGFFALLVIAALLSARGLVGSGSLGGGALLPAPGSAFDWWRTYLSSVPSGAYLLPLAVAGTVLVGSASFLIGLVFLLAVPLAAWGGYRFLRLITSSRPMSLWGAAAYGVLPVVSGSVQQGRLGTVAGCLVLPWLAAAAVGMDPDGSADRRARGAWRTALWLAVLTAFVPLAWPLAAGLAVVAVVVSRARRAAVVRDVAVALLAALLLLLPWTVETWSRRGAASWLFEAGLPSPGLTASLSRWDLVLGRPGAGAPAWISAGVLVAAVLALARPDTRRSTLRAWIVVVVALGGTAVVASGSYVLSTTSLVQRPWLGFPLLLAQAAGITAAALAGTGLRHRLTGSSFGWRQPVGLLVVGLAALTPVVSVAWWVASGSGGPLERGPATVLPAYMSDASPDRPADRPAGRPADGALVVRGSGTSGLSFVLLHGPGLRTGDDTVAPSVAEQAPLAAVVRDLATAADPVDVEALGRLGVAYVYAPAPVDGSLAANLDSLSGVDRASADAPGARAWQLGASVATPAAAESGAPRDPLRPWLLLVQALAVVVAVVLAVPGRRNRP